MTTDTTDVATLLVLSCDEYADLWLPFFSVLDRCWPNCPLPIVFVSNEKSLSHAGVRQIQVGPERSWSDTLLTALTQLTTEYVVLWQEDQFPIDVIDTAEVMGDIEWLDARHGNYLHLNPNPRPQKGVDAGHGEVLPGQAYRVSVMPTIWRTSALKRLLVSGETGWDFENYGSVRSDDMTGFYACTHFTIPLVNGVVKGKWVPWRVSRLVSLGVALDLDARQVMGWQDTVRLRLAIARSKVFSLIPWKWRRRVKGWTLPLRPSK